jgi:ribosomal protein L7/L12
MTNVDKMKTRSELVDECRALRIAEGATEEDMIVYLRAQGCYKLDAVVVLREVFGLGLGEAKALVHLSPTWQDAREKDDAFHETFVSALEGEFGASSNKD